MTPPGPKSHRAGPIRYRWVLLGVMVVVWVGLCALTLLRSATQLQSGVAMTSRVRGEVSAQDLVDNRVGGDLNAAVQHFDRAHRMLSEPWLTPLGVLPYVGRQLHSAQALAAAADTVGRAGSQTVDQAHLLLNAPHATPVERVGVIRRLATTIATLDRQTSHVSLGPGNALLPVLAAKRATFASDLAKLRTGLARGTGATAALTDLLTGPRTYLVLASNNAEMRDGSGMFLEAGTVTANQGTLTFSSFTPTSQLYNPNPTVPLTGDLQRLWAQFQPNQEWRSLALSPQFSPNAALAGQMWQSQMGQKVDGVLSVDIRGLRSILEATGPVSGGGATVDAGNVEQTLLKDQYIGQSSSSDYGARQDLLGGLAGAVLGAVQQPGVPIGRLVTDLARAGGGRHLLLWSADPGIEADWTAANVNGNVSGDGMLLGLNNTGGNKLDPYEQISAQLTTVRAGSDTRVSVVCSITNRPAAGLSPYVLGDGTSVAPGTYVGIATLDFPKAAGQARVDRPAVSATGSDYTSEVIAVPVTLAPGESTTVTWSFLLAGNHGRLSIVPSARIPATGWRATGGRTFTDEGTSTVAW